MKRLLPILLCSLLLSGLRNATAQEASKTWTLQECLDYAYQNNIQVRQSRNNQLSGIEDTKQAKAALFPSLVASTTQSYTNYPSSEVTDNNSYTGTYGITAGMTIFEGGKLRTEVKRQKVQNQMDALSVEESVNDIRIAIVQAYMQCLYAADAVRINRMHFYNLMSGYVGVICAMAFMGALVYLLARYRRERTVCVGKNRLFITQNCFGLSPKIANTQQVK